MKKLFAFACCFAAATVLAFPPFTFRDVGFAGSLPPSVAAPPQAAAPTFDPDGGGIPIEVSIACDTDGSTIYWTTNNWEGTNSGPSPVELLVNTVTEIKAYSTAPGYVPSDVTTSESYIQWTPASVAGLALWLTPEKLTNSLSEGQGVASWADASSNGVTVAQATADNQPYVTNAVVNGYPGAFFGGTDDYLDISANDMHRNATGAVVVVVCSRGGTSTRSIYFYSQGDSVTTSRIQILAGGTSDLTYRITRIDSENASSMNISPWGVSSEARVLELTVNWAGGAQELRTNNVAAVTGALGTIGNTTDDTADRVWLGGGEGYFIGRIVELLVFENIPTSSEMTNLRSYLSTKYALW